MEEKLRVVLANDSFPPVVDGVANTVMNYGRQITARHGSAIVATPYYPDVVDHTPFEVVRYTSLNTQKKMGYRTGYPFSVPAIKRLAAFKPDIIHSHCPVASQLLCRELRDMTNVPMVFTYHTKFDQDVARTIKSGLLQEAAVKGIIRNIEASDEVWAVCEGAAANLRSLGYNGEIRLMLNGVDFPYGPADEAATRALSEQYHLPEDIPCFLFVGRMMWYKGQKYILEALKMIQDRGYDFRMVFIGSGTDTRAIGTYATELGIKDRVTQLESIHDRELLRAWYSRADLFLLPSVFDNNPIVVKEASACGTASVLIRGSSSAEGTTDRRNCLHMGENSEDLAALLMEIIDHPGMAQELGQHALDELYVPWETQIDLAVKRYRELIELKKRGELPPHPKALGDPFIKALGKMARVSLKDSMRKQKDRLRMKFKHDYDDEE